MRISVELPLVTCELMFSDGLADVASFRAGAANARWTNSEITVAVAKAFGESNGFDDVGRRLQQYCTAGLAAEFRNAGHCACRRQVYKPGDSS